MNELTTSSPSRDRGFAEVDIHCHCLPGIDDGPKTIDESIALCRRLVADGVKIAIATPHQLGRYDGINIVGWIRDLTGNLNKTLQDSGVALAVLPGADVRVDERIVELIDTDRILTLADKGRYLLLELPHDIWFPPPGALLQSLAERGITGILSHPERHRQIMRRPELVEQWTAAGAVLQVTAGSLCGDFGDRSLEVSNRLIAGGLVSLVASDAHGASNRPPRMRRATRRIVEHFGPEIAKAICMENPRRVIEGVDLVEPPVVTGSTVRR